MRYRAEVAFGVLAVAGLLLVGYGLNQPAYTTEMTVVGPIGDGDIAESADVVAYGSLSEEQRRTFDRARTTESDVGYDSQNWPEQPDVVRYEGSYYELSTWGGENAGRILSIAAGWALVLVGGVGIGVTQLIRRWVDGPVRLFSS